MLLPRADSAVSSLSLLIATTHSSGNEQADVQCYTQWGQHEPPFVLRVTQTITTTLPAVIERAQSTITVTETAIIKPISAETSISTEMLDITVTSTNLLTLTETQTSTATSTAVVPTSSGFRPVSDTQKEAFTRKHELKKRSRFSPYSQKVVNLASGSGQLTSEGLDSEPQKTLIAADYPAEWLDVLPSLIDHIDPTSGEQARHVKAVACVVVVEERPTITVGGSPVTQTATITQSLSSNAAITSAQTSTLTNSWTIVENATTTMTELATANKTVSSYAACATSNILSVAPDGDLITNIYNAGQVEGPSLFDIAAAPSAEDCCVLCHSTPECQASAFSKAQANTCILLHISEKTCPEDDVAELFFVSNSATVSGYSISNGNCGYLKHAAT